MRNRVVQHLVGWPVTSWTRQWQVGRVTIRWTTFSRAWRVEYGHPWRLSWVRHVQRVSRTQQWVLECGPMTLIVSRIPMEWTGRHHA